MKIKIGDNIYDGSKEPIMVILTDKDKENIKRMLTSCTLYCQYPDDMTEEQIDLFMKIKDEA